MKVRNAQVGLVAAAVVLAALAFSALGPNRQLLPLERYGPFGSPRGPAHRTLAVQTRSGLSARSVHFARGHPSRASRRRVCPSSWHLVAACVVGTITTNVMMNPLSTGDWDLLAQSRRRRILSEIRRIPGIHYRELQRRIGIGDGDLRYHLESLVRAGSITSAEKLGRVHFFELGFHGRRDVLSLPDLDQKILDFVQTVGEATESDLMSAFGLSHGNASEHLHRLQTEGLVESHRTGHTLRWHQFR